MEYTQDTKEAVMLGAACLDIDEPRWFKFINLDDLDMSEVNRCIVGQVQPRSNDQDRDLSYRGFSDAYGFDLLGNPADYEEGDREDGWCELQAAWEEQILARIMAMDIGKEKPPIKVEPLEDPVPAETPATPEREPRTVPQKAPERAPEQPKRAPVKP